ncbi:MAG: acyclic terpene utilization AtuA family protein, partial [Sciscionella sp.]
MTSDSGPIRIGNASGFYGDRFAAVREMLTGGPLDVLTGDYLAELTMLILGRDRMKDPARGYAKTFLRQMEENLGLALDNGVTIVANAGGLNPEGLAGALRELAGRLGLRPRIGYVVGDDVVDRAAEFGLGQPLTANVYLGAWGITECLRAGADVVVTGRVTDASVVVGPAAARFGWQREDYDALAGAVVAGHVIECGAQATGGNYAFFAELLREGRQLDHPGFPIAEIHPDGSSVITKHPGSHGAVTAGTVTAQLLYEIGDARYPGPDVTARFDTVGVSEVHTDRVRISGVRGEPPPPELKVCLNTLGGFRNEVEFVLTGLEIEAKAELVRGQLEAAFGERQPAEVRWSLVRTDRTDAETEEQASTVLRCVVRDPDQKVVGRAFSGAAVETALASYPGFHLTAPPGDASPYGVYRPAFVPATAVDHVAVLPDGSTTEIPPPAQTCPLRPVPPPALPEPLPATATRRAPLGMVVGARSGDKAGSANVGLWARSESAWRWLAHAITVEEFRRLLPETEGLPVSR